MRRFCKWGFEWLYGDDDKLRALILPFGLHYRVIREDQREPVEFDTYAEAFIFARSE